MNQKTVQRLDIFESELSSVQRTDEGFAHFFARATRIGVFLYRNADGSLRRELRHPDEVFKPESMKTLESKPITNDHPLNMVDSKNVREYTVGVTGQEVMQDGIFLKTKAIVMDQETINDVINKGKAQVSCGYFCEHIEKPGIYDGEPYDVIQTNIRYNHVAIVDVGRAGPEVKLRLDSGDAIMLSENQENADTIETIDAKNSGRTLQTVIVSKSAASTLEEAKKIVEKLSNAHIGKSEETEESFRFRQKDPSLFKEKSFRSFKPTGLKGVTMVFGKLKDSKKDALSHSDMREGLENLLRQQYGSGDFYLYIEDIIGNEVIYNIDSKDPSKSGMFKQEFQSIDDKLSLAGNISRVQEITSYKVIDKKEKIKEDKQMVKIKIDGIEQEVSEEFAKAFDAQEKKVNDSLKKVSELQAQVDDLNEKVDAKEDEAKKMDSVKELNERVKARVALYHAAKDNCDEEILAKLDSMSDLEIKKCIIKSAIKNDSLNLDEKDEAYINARFDIVMEDAAKKDNGIELGKAILDSKHHNIRSDRSSETNPRYTNWKKPMTKSKMKESVK